MFSELIRKIKNQLFWLFASEKFRVIKTTARGSIIYQSNFRRIRRKIWVYVPAGYEPGNPANRTVYMYDGQNVFDIGAGAYGTWSLEDHLDNADDSRTIIVGIQHGIERESDYSLSQNADRTIRSVCANVIPFIEKKFTAAQTAAQRFIGGSSLGANAAIAAIPCGSFGGTLLFSTAVEVDYPEHLEYIKQLPIIDSMRVYMDIGAKEASCQDLSDVSDYGMVARCVEIQSVLKNRCGENNVVLRVDHDNCYHCEEAWGIRFAAALSWLIQKPLYQ